MCVAKCVCVSIYGTVNDVQYVANFNHGIGMVLPQKKLIQILLGRSSRRVTQKSLASNLAIQNEGYNQQKHRTTTLKWQGLTKKRGLVSWAWEVGVSSPVLPFAFGVPPFSHALHLAPPRWGSSSINKVGKSQNWRWICGSYKLIIYNTICS